MHSVNRTICHLFFILLLVPALNPAFASDAKNELPPACRTDCVSPYGSVLGADSDKVKAYSNCQSNCVIFEPNKWHGTYTGIKWQCVEYARRWLLIHKGMVYGDVDVAADIWNKIDHLTRVSTKKQVPLKSYVNGSIHAPEVGDLLVYARAFYNTGHVAVVTEVDLKKGLIKVGEQNYNNKPWPGNYARSIQLYKKGDHYWLLDAYILGWKHAEG